MTQPRDSGFVPQVCYAFVMPEPDIAFVPHRRLSFAPMRWYAMSYMKNSIG
jgi:hypothetical protein